MKLYLPVLFVLSAGCALMQPQRVEVVGLSAARGERCWSDGETLIEDLDTRERKWVCGIYGKPGERFRLKTETGR